MAVTHPIVPHGQDRPSTQSRGSEPSRLVYAAWLYSSMFPRQDRDTTGALFLILHLGAGEQLLDVPGFLPVGLQRNLRLFGTGTTGSVVKIWLPASKS